MSAEIHLKSDDYRLETVVDHPTEREWFRLVVTPDNVDELELRVRQARAILDRSGK